MLLQIDTKRIEPDMMLVSFTGKIALGRESQRIETLIGDLQEQKERKFIFDISHVDHVDSTGIGILAFCYGTVARCGGKLRIAGAHGKVLHIFQVTKLDSIMPLYETVEEAARDFK